MARIYTRQEVKRRRLRFQVFAGLFDFLGIIAGVIVIGACAMLLYTLIRWAIGDIQWSFQSLWDIFMSAIIIPE